jgi:4-aminobutyrate aminotransferase-like enzyme
MAATGATGGIVTDHSYHGVTTAIADLSPEEWAADFHPMHMERIAPPSSATPAAEDTARAVERLAERGVALAATYLDGGFTSDGIHAPAAEGVAAIVDTTRAAGGLFVADEVQAGHGRTGEHLWSFVRYGVVPDLVTLGKPMGNGYPVAAVIARRELVEQFATTTSFFSTFGGNPVAAQAALAVLDVIADERLLENAARVGGYLRERLERLRADEPSIVDVRGCGLLVGVELANAALAERVVDAMRDGGVLIGRTGRGGNVLKIRPPLVFAREHADLLLDVLPRALAAAAA